MKIIHKPNRYSLKFEAVFKTEHMQIQKFPFCFVSVWVLPAAQEAGMRSIQLNFDSSSVHQQDDIPKQNWNAVLHSASAMMY